MRIERISFKPQKKKKGERANNKVAKRKIENGISLGDIPKIEKYLLNYSELINS